MARWSGVNAGLDDESDSQLALSGRAVARSSEHEHAENDQQYEERIASRRRR